nr:hypothetical protein CFP56_42791 [Quercus suber]
MHQITLEGTSSMVIEDRIQHRHLRGYGRSPPLAVDTFKLQPKFTIAVKKSKNRCLFHLPTNGAVTQ